MRVIEPRRPLIVKIGQRSLLQFRRRGFVFGKEGQRRFTVELCSIWKTAMIASCLTTMDMLLIVYRTASGSWMSFKRIWIDENDTKKT
jgi:hypothetical protein